MIRMRPRQNLPGPLSVSRSGFSPMSFAIDLIAGVFLLPLLVVQALQVRRRALILPEASGPRQGVAGTGPKLRLLIVGDSSAAGVGAATQDQALAGRLVDRLARHFTIEWRLEARTGATTGSTLRHLAGTAPFSCDVALVILGVNDTTRGATLRGWRHRLAQVFDLLETRFATSHIYASGVPPMAHFPLLPQPLAWMLGRHAARLDRGMATLAAERRECHHVPMDLPFDLSLAARDGFHPGPAAYDLWAEALATRMIADLAPTAPAQQHSTEREPVLNSS